MATHGLQVILQKTNETSIDCFIGLSLLEKINTTNSHIYTIFLTTLGINHIRKASNHNVIFYILTKLLRNKF